MWATCPTLAPPRWHHATTPLLLCGHPAARADHTPCVRVLCAPQPAEIYVDDESKLTLHGLVQHYVMLHEEEKNRKLTDLLDALDFNQARVLPKPSMHACMHVSTCLVVACTGSICFAPEIAPLPALSAWRMCTRLPQVVIFVKSVQRAKTLNALLNECNFPSVCIYAGMPQEKRLEVYKQFKDNQVHTQLPLNIATLHHWQH